VTNGEPPRLGCGFLFRPHSPLSAGTPVRIYNHLWMLVSQSSGLLPPPPLALKSTLALRMPVFHGWDLFAILNPPLLPKWLPGAPTRLTGPPRGLRESPLQGQGPFGGGGSWHHCPDPETLVRQPCFLSGAPIARMAKEPGADPTAADETVRPPPSPPPVHSPPLLPSPGRPIAAIASNAGRLRSFDGASCVLCVTLSHRILVIS